MTGIELTGSPRLLAVDFHSHTRWSHDGRQSFTVARNREWHEAGGFHAAYVTDHYTWAGAEDGQETNGARAGDGLALLPGAELRLRGRYVNVLGAAERYAFALDSTGQHLNPDSITAASRRGGSLPTMLYTIPGPLEQVVAFTPVQPAGVVAIELNDGAPRGLEQIKGQRRRLLDLADSLNLAMVAGANLHGWGRTVAAWSLMDVAGWRDMTPAQLGAAIEETLHAKRREAVTVVERRNAVLRGVRPAARRDSAVAAVGALADAELGGAAVLAGLDRRDVLAGGPLQAASRRKRAAPRTPLARASGGEPCSRSICASASSTCSTCKDTTTSSFSRYCAHRFSLSQWRRLLVLVTAFTAGHTLSLALATRGSLRGRVPLGWSS